jgi:4-diphosphocytidyl-2C-methyl-D-erythritol kinase
VACAHLWSSDASPPSLEALADIARRVGADVPYFLAGGTALGTGKGDHIVPLAELPPQWLVIVAPCSVSVSTPAAYAAYDEANGWVGDEPGGAPAVAESKLEEPGYSGKLDPAWMGNDLHSAVVDLHPEVEEARRALKASGAGIAQMSGSGSASFGTFDDRRSARRAAGDLRGRGFRAWTCVTVSRHQHARSLAGLGQ